MSALSARNRRLEFPLCRREPTFINGQFRSEALVNFHQLGLVTTSKLIRNSRRGYVGRWRVESGCLYLDAISGKYALTDDKPVLADWITGKFELTSIPNPGWFPSEANTTYEILVTKGVVWGFRKLPED
jgi:hypothetical protein